jgi:hypothetical protein
VGGIFAVTGVPSVQPKAGKEGAGGIGQLLGGMSTQGKDSDTPLSSLAGLMGGAGAEAPKGKLTDEEWANPGTGPYPAQWSTDPTLPQKTIYAPKIPPPANIKLPVIVWGEGGCYQTGIFYAPFLLEIASHGYIIIANGPPSGRSPTTVAELQKLTQTPQSKISDLFNSINWVLKAKASRFGTIDTSKIAAAGQSCGGSEALSAAYRNDNIKLTILINSGTGSEKSKEYLTQFKYPVGIFNGGPKDIAHKNVGLTDYFWKLRSLILSIYRAL